MAASTPSASASLAWLNRRIVDGDTPIWRPSAVQVRLWRCRWYRWLRTVALDRSEESPSTSRLVRRLGRRGRAGSSVDVVTVLIQYSEMTQQVEAVAELDEVLNRIAVRARPTLVELHSETGVLCLGMGRDDAAVVLFRDEVGGSWWERSRDGSSLGAFEDLVFDTNGSTHRFFDRAAVRPSQMREAAREFVRTPAARPAILDWLPEGSDSDMTERDDDGS